MFKPHGVGVGAGVAVAVAAAVCAVAALVPRAPANAMTSAPQSRKPRRPNTACGARYVAGGGAFVS